MEASLQFQQRALVVGGASGIGAAVVRRLRQQGCEVVCADRDLERAQATAVAVGATAIGLDATCFDEVRQCVHQTGHYGILVNCVGLDQHAFFTQTAPEQWREMLSVNLETVFNAVHAVLPGMQAAGYGRIVNLASEAGRLGSRGAAAYAAAKGGVIAFTRSIARENAKYNIMANVVAPGPIDTPLLQQAVAGGGEHLLQAMTAATLLGRLGTPEEVAAAVVFLAAPEASFITGEVLGVSGGMGCGA